MRKDLPASGGLGSVSNALRVLSLAVSQGSVRVVDASRELQISVSTAHRLLSCLRDEGYLQQRPDSRRYTVGPELLQLARQVSTQHTLERSARPHLEALCQEVSETVNLHILRGPEVLCIETVAEHRHMFHVRHIVGFRRPAYASAAGKLLLSALPAQEVRALYPDGLQAIAPRTITDLDVLERELAAVRDRGYATNLGEGEEGVHAVAVGVSDPKHRPIAALSIAAPVTRMPAVRAQGLVPQLRRTSDAITAAFFSISR